MVNTARERPIRGRAAQENPANRFEELQVISEESETQVQTQIQFDTSRSILTRNESPDIGFDVSLNPYRGCEHGCIYCYARPTHEYLGFSSGLDFESRILVKKDAPDLLRRELSSRRWTPQVIALSGVTDPYQPLEREWELTRACLSLLADCRNPVGIVTKSHLATRDLDLLERLHEHSCISVSLSITTLDDELHRHMEPRSSSPARRLDAVQILSEAGIPVRVLVAPVIPGLNDHEIPAILEEAARRGARSAGFQMLRLPHGVKELFSEWLLRTYPYRHSRVMNRIREIRTGKLNDSRFYHRMSGQGTYAEQIRQLFERSLRQVGLDEQRGTELSTDSFRRPGGQLTLSFSS